MDEFAKNFCLEEFNYLIQNIVMNPIYEKRLDPFNKLCRYEDIRTYKDNRVEIKSKNKYINASWIHMPYYNYFIATQGPLDSTIEDFWEMCFSYNVNVIVMLCKLIEGENEKCANYWEAKLQNYEIIEIEKNKLDEGLILKKFKIINKNNYKTKNINHIHLTSWDDHTAPINNYYKIIEIIKFVEKYKGNSPAIVHCSAGVGRTGTFISVFNLYHEIIEQIQNKFKKEIKFSILNLVRKLKEMRLHLVENDDQYIFLYHFAQKLLNEKN